jgi:hypothetical protein
MVMFFNCELYHLRVGTSLKVEGSSVFFFLEYGIWLVGREADNETKVIKD